jgi:hypothetical protein
MRGRPILAMHIDVTPDQLLGAAARCRIMELSNEVYPPGSIPDWVGTMQWAPKTIHTMVWNEGLLVSHVGALVRDVIIDGRLMQVGGIGGVMTAPAARRRGHARAALAAMGRHVIDDQQVSFLLLFCPADLYAFYEHLGWQSFKNAPVVDQGSKRVQLTFCRTMVRDGKEIAPASGILDLRGPPW